METISLIPAEEVISGRGKEEKYEIAIEKHIEWIIENIKSSKNGMIIVKIRDIAKEMGPEFANKTPIVMYKHLKDILLDKNIIAELGTHLDGDKLLIMRLASKERMQSENKIEMGAIEI